MINALILMITFLQSLAARDWKIKNCLAGEATVTSTAHIPNKRGELAVEKIVLACRVLAIPGVRELESSGSLREAIFNRDRKVK